ncbi:nucleotidyltransferase domain-containing protein [Aromatoleum diolicum]|uniref:Nucleotidyltransferase domain-containing protein n=1 Tax=Aromatoleum diolicum TaxID=75796 RepID=A0ABX1QH67_9RHOO|nr:nucleotidyltransferase domain-containing protein [Aromatoleum diolicum]NMG77293.1 nucleotidyltransferase domain-containing protein [Aromatoleum diolicum]
MLMDILFGAYRKRVLSLLLLNPDADYHVRELARLTGTSAGTLHKELTRLAAAGLLLRKEQGNQVRYQANRECPVFAELAGLFRKTTGLAGVIAETIAPLRPQLALIFGSIARGDETARSDVDLLMIGDIGFADAVRVLHPLQERLQREINPVIYRPDEFVKRLQAGDRFAGEILAKPKLFITGTADDLGKLVGDTPAAAL